MTVADSSYALDHGVPAERLSSEATVGPSAAHESASFRGIGLCVLVLVAAIELLWVGFLLFAVAHIA